MINDCGRFMLNQPEGVYNDHLDVHYPAYYMDIVMEKTRKIDLRMILLPALRTWSMTWSVIHSSSNNRPCKGVTDQIFK